MNLFYVNNPVGVSVSLYTPWISLSGRKSQFGLMTTLSSSNSLDSLMIEGDKSTLKDTLGLNISPYGTMYLGAGKLNFSLNVNALSIKNWESFLNNICVIAGYKVAL